MEHYKINTTSTNAMLATIIIILMIMIGIISDTWYRLQKIKTEVMEIRSDTFELVSGTMTGKIGQPVGQEYQINKNK